MRTLLLADDSNTVQRVIALTFAEEPISVVTTSDGRQAMELLASQKPDIVLAGTTLPHVSGYDLAQFIRSKPDLKGIPVLLLSGAFETVDNARLMSSGANGVLEKPVEPTVVIGRVKELLGLKSDPKPATAGRLVTSAGGPHERKVPWTPPSVTSTRPTPSSQWDQLRDRTGLDANTRSVEDPSMRADDYLDTLDEAFDSLDRQISGRAQQQRNPSGPLGQSGGAADPRSPGRSPAAGQPGNPVFEVDDEWFAEDEKARAQRNNEHRQLAAEMGLNDLAPPPVEIPKPQAIAVEPVMPLSPIADDFAALLAYEQGEQPPPPIAASAAPEVKLVTPEITDDMLDQIAARVADRLSASGFGDWLKDAMASTMRETVRDTVRTVVTETSERLVREEIDRIKSKSRT